MIKKMNGFKTTLTGGRLGKMFGSAADAFLHKIDPQLHAGAYIGEHSGGFAETEFAGKYLDTSVRYCKYFKDIGRDADAALALDNAKTVVGAIIENQREDGYIGGLGEGHETEGFSVWNQAFTMLGLVSYFELTGDRAALGAAERIAEYNALIFMGGADICGGSNNGSQHLSLLLPLVRLSAYSDNGSIALFAHFIVSRIRSSDNNFLDFGSILELRSKKGIENFVILLGLLEYGERFDFPDATDACMKYWDELASTQIRENGNGTLGEVWTENGSSPRMLGEADRPDENCVAVGWIEFSLALWRLTHEPKYLDEIERTLYNHLLGAVSEDGADFAYYQPNYGKKLNITPESMYKCCRYRGHSAVSQLPEMLFSRIGDTIFTMVYTDEDYEDEDVRIEERAVYPYGSEVSLKLKFHRECHRKLVLRVPKDVSSVEVLLDSVPLDVRPERGLITLSISAGGEHELRLSFGVEPVRKPVVVDGVDRIGFTYGSLLLAAETDDDPAALTVDPNAPIIPCGEGFGFRIGDVKLTDYASAGRSHGFVVWCRSAG